MACQLLIIIFYKATKAVSLTYGFLSLAFKAIISLPLNFSIKLALIMQLFAERVVATELAQIVASDSYILFVFTF